MPILFTALALAGPDAGESRRLNQEIARLAERSAWQGVERKYGELLELRRPDVPASTHLMAAHAAQSVGDMGRALIRAERAVQGSGSDFDVLQEASTWIADVRVNYGEVHIELSVAFRGETTVTPAEAVFAPTTRTVLDFATDTLMNDRAFSGYLPLGSYTIGNTSFDVLGDAPLKVFVKPVRGAERIRPESKGMQSARIAVRGDGWRPSEWDTVSAGLTKALSNVKSVRSVEVETPAPWVLFSPDTAALSSRGLTIVDVSAALSEQFSDLQVPYSTELVAVGPGADLSKVSAAAIGDATAGELGTLELGHPDLPIRAVRPPATPYAVAFQTDADPTAAFNITRAVPGASALKLTLEVEEAP